MNETVERMRSEMNSNMLVVSGELHHAVEESSIVKYYEKISGVTVEK